MRFDAPRRKVEPQTRSEWQSSLLGKKSIIHF